jgi:class 3 adenylate cyclase/tetratricopeptide (TPR) repeat protein
VAVSIVPACPACGASHAPGARFCASCGAALELVCARCGESLSATDAFCSRCGAAVAPATRTVSSQPAGARPESSLRRSGEERKHVTILFADVAGSTTLADRLDPETLRDVMQRYFAAMREEIEAEGGTVEKFIGDAVMAVFGVPVAHEDDPSRALRAADAMGRRLAAVNAGLAISRDLSLQMRIGVNTGEVVTAAAGEPGATLVTGDAVNVAARLQTSADPGDVLVSERTARAARGFEFVRRGTLQIKGRREPVCAFRTTGRVAGNGGAPSLTAALVGRDAEIAVLDSVYARSVDERRPHVVTVYGDAGVGKSRLVREFLDRAQDDAPAPLVLRGRCLPYGDGVTYWPLAEMLKAYAGIRDTDSASEVLARIREVTATLWATGAQGDDAPRAAAMLAYTLGVTDPHAPAARTDPQEVRGRVHAAWRAFFSALASAGPVVVLVEDIHWADPALLDLLDESGERVKGPVLFVFASRPELAATRPGWGGGRRNSLAVSLDPLPPDDARRLVKLLLTVDDLPSSVHERILERAEGNPFFLEEILRRLIDERLLRRERGRWRAAPGIEAIELPDSVQGVLASRIDLLAPADKLVLQAAAVVGRVFWREPLRLLTAGLLEGLSVEPASEGRPDESALEESLRRLEARDLVSAQVGSAFAGQPEYLFKHVLTRDVAYDGIPRRERGAAHAQVARWLERTAGDRAPEFGELLAHHYATAAGLAAQAGDESDPGLRLAAVEWLLRASDDARSKYVLGKAEHLAHDALELAQSDVERCDVLTALGSAYLVGASVSDVRGDLAWRHLAKAAAVADESPDIPDLRAARLIARACELPVRWPGHMSVVPPEPEVRALRDRGLALAGPGDSRERASLLAISASWPFAFPAESTEPLEVCVARGLEAADVALRLGDADLASACYDAATSGYESLGDFRSAMEIWRRRWRLRDRLTDDLEVVDLYGMGAWESWETADYEGAIRYAEAIEGKLQHPGAAHAQAWRVTALFRLGRWDEALATFAAMRERLDTRRGSPPNAYTQMYGAAAIVYEARADRRRADEVAAAIAAVPDYGCRVYAWRVEVALQRGEFERARKLAAAPPPDAWQVHASVVWEARCDTVLASGDWERAAEVVEGARQYNRAGGSPSVAAVAGRLEGAAAIAAGDADRAVRLLATAVREFDGLGMTWEAARTRRLLAAALARAGRREQAAAEQAAADGALNALGVVDDRVIDAALSAPQIRELGHTA